MMMKSSMNSRYKGKTHTNLSLFELMLFLIRKFERKNPAFNLLANFFKNMNNEFKKNLVAALTGSDQVLVSLMSSARNTYEIS